MFRTGLSGLMLLIMALSFGCARTSMVERTSRWTPKAISQSRLPKFDMPITVNDRVVAWLDYFQGPGRSHFARYLARSGKYLPMMQDVLQKYALPQDLVYIALIESGFSSRAYSRAHAAGYWQFIRSTGRHYGLQINNWMDERRDPVDSTIAAAKYLRDLFDEFGDWYLAMAAYNAGEGKIRKAVAKTGTRDFWKMIERDRRYLRTETKDYVPKFIAAAILAKSPERFGFGDVVFDSPVESEKSAVDSQTDLQVISKCAGVPLDVVQELNPELIRGATPPNEGNYSVNLPKGSADEFKIAFAKVPSSERMMIARHIVKRGETAGRIARRYGVSVREILAANDLRSASSLKRGMSLIIPTGGATKQRAKEVAIANNERPSGKFVKHRVQKGETLGLIAQDYGVSVSDLKRWNHVKRTLIRAGQTLKVYGTEEVSSVTAVAKASHKQGSASYKVRRGDSWWKVAQKYGVSINELKGWNSSTADKDLMIGQNLRLFTSPVSSETVALSTNANAPPQMSIENSFSDKLETPNKNVEPSGGISGDLLAIQLPSTNKESKNDEASGSSVSYKVKTGDTLWDIAKKYGVSVSDIMKWNNFNKKTSKRLKPGKFITLKTPVN